MWVHCALLLPTRLHLEFFSWATNPSPRLISRSIMLDYFDFKLKDHRAPVEIPGTSNK